MDIHPAVLFDILIAVRILFDKHFHRINKYKHGFLCPLRKRSVLAVISALAHYRHQILAVFKAELYILTPLKQFPKPGIAGIFFVIMLSCPSRSSVEISNLTLKRPIAIKAACPIPIMHMRTGAKWGIHFFNCAVDSLIRLDLSRPIVSG